MVEKELTVEIKDKDEYESEEDAILAMTEFSGYGYEAETAIKAAWLRGIRDGQDPFERAFGLAQYGSTSIDADLLPTRKQG
jgi:hypothetical protein